MPDEALKHILDREGSRAQIAKNFGPSLDLMHEVTSYGTNLIARCLHSSARELPDMVALCVFLKQVVEMLDAIEVLVRESSVRPARLQARSLLESLVYLEFVLKSDSARRARAYYVWNLRQQRLWNRRTLKDTPERRSYEELLGEHYVDTLELHPELEENVRRDEEEITKFLERPEYKDLDESFKAEAERRGHEPTAWHSVLGCSSFRSVCREVGRLHEYHVFYDLDSTVAHGSSYRQHVRVEHDHMVLEPLRNPEGLPTLIKIALSTAFHAYRVVIQRYRPAEEAAFDRKYQREWRQRFQSIPVLEVQQQLQPGFP